MRQFRSKILAEDFFVGFDNLTFRIVVFGNVSQHNRFEVLPVMEQQLRRLLVGQVPMRRTDSVLQFRRIIAVLEHNRVVVAFQQQSVNGLHNAGQFIKNAAQIRADAKALFPVVRDETDSVYGVVRRFNRLDV